MASSLNKLEDIVIFELTDPSDVTDKLSDEEITISTACIHNWDIPSIACHRIVKVQADRSRLSQKSCYFHGLLSGSFSESSLCNISIHWCMESILNILQFIYGHRLIITSANFLHLFEGTILEAVTHLKLLEDWPLKCDRMIQFLVYIGLGSIRHLRYIKLDNHLLTALVERWCPQTNTFHLPVGEMTITLQDVQILLGVRCNGDALVGPNVVGHSLRWPSWVECCKTLLGSHPDPDNMYQPPDPDEEAVKFRMGNSDAHSMLPLRWLRWHFHLKSYASLPENDFYQHVRAYILYIFGCLLFPDTSGSHVHLEHLPLLEDFGLFRQYSVGSAVLAHLYRNLYLGTKPTRVYMAGCLHLLQLWSWERLHVGRPTFHVLQPQRLGGKPLGYRWNQERNREVPTGTVSNYRDELDGLQDSQAALFFGVDGLLLECEAWFKKITSGFGVCRHQIPLATIVEISNFSMEHGITSIMGTYKDYLARNFAWAASCSSFVDIPYALLYSAIEHPELTVESEVQLCDALLRWLSHNVEFGECFSINSRDSYYNILKKVRICLLSLDFATGIRSCFPSFADDIIHAILFLLYDQRSSSTNTLEEVGCSKILRIRLTKYSEKIVLCGCPQVTLDILFLGILPNDFDSRQEANLLPTLMKPDHDRGDYSCVIQKAVSLLSFESVVEVDISKCPNLRFASVIPWLYLAFPSLSILKASHYLDFKYENLYSLLRMCPLIVEVDLTVDISPLILEKVSILSTNVEEYQIVDAMRYKILEEQITLPSISEVISAKPVFANISKLTLEGRRDTNDQELLKISSLSHSLSFLNIKGCTLVTDLGISKLLMNCRCLQSLISSYTGFGRISIITLCSENLFHNSFQGPPDNSSAMASRLHQLEIDGCKDVDNNSLLHLMSEISIMTVLSLRETSLDDDALYKLASHSLETLDISDTQISMQSLSYVINRNPEMRSLRLIGCPKLRQDSGQNLAYSHGMGFEDILDELGKRCILEELALGWGFSSISLDRLQPAFGKLKAIYVGLGAEVDHHLLCFVPKICPLLESLVLRFQVISDDIVRSILESLKHLRTLWLCCCLGYFTSVSFQIQKLNLTSLRLDWVTPWMTNNDLTVLTQNCSYVFELSLSGCKLLDPDSQEIIASGWPGLKNVHLEECGKITSKGVSFLFNCKAIEELLLRHNGKGLARNFIVDAASKLPLLRKLSLDLCDAVQCGLDSPSHSERFYLSTVKICRCKAQRCAFELEKLGGFKPVHKETIVLEYTGKQLRTTVVKERI